MSVRLKLKRFVPSKALVTRLSAGAVLVAAAGLYFSPFQPGQPTSELTASNQQTLGLQGASETRNAKLTRQVSTGGTALDAARLKPVPGAKAGSYQEMSRVVSREDWNAVSTGERSLMRSMLKQARMGFKVSDPCFAPNTPPAVMRAFSRLGDSLNLATSATRATRGYPDGRWSGTATNPNIAPGDSFTLTWNLVPDGTKETDANGTASDLQAWAVATYGSEEAFRAVLRKVFARYEELTGIHYQEVTYDDGAPYGYNSNGELNVRADVRIGGKKIDGDYNVLAYDTFPNSGDMTIDTADAFYKNVGTSDALFNTLAHEHGHGLGLSHSCPQDGTKLMEPAVNSGFHGPQLDDILGVQFHYGDRYEQGARNNTVGTATDLGTLPIGTKTLTEVSLNGSSSDIDFYKFTPESNNRMVTVQLVPAGNSYLLGTQNADGSCSDGTTFNPVNQRDMSLQLVTGAGTILAKSNTGGAGDTETLTNVPLTGSTSFYIQVQAVDSAQAVQGYNLIITERANSATPTPAPTKTPRPTATPAPTATPTPRPTATPVPGNHRPVINFQGFTPAQPKTNDALKAAWTTSDYEGDPVKVAVEWTVNEQPIDQHGTGINLAHPGFGDKNDNVGITLTATDGRGGVTIFKGKVKVANTAPEGGTYKGVATEDEVFTGDLAGSATDIDGDTLNYELSGRPTLGTIIINSNGSFAYRPKANVNGTDVFTVRAKDDQSFGTVTVTIVIRPANDPPVTSGASFELKEDETLSGTLLAKDPEGGALAYTLGQNAEHGVVTIARGGRFAYKPNARYNGTDSFTFKATDSSGAVSNISKVTLRILSVNGAPRTESDGFITNFQTPINISGAQLTKNDDTGDLVADRDTLRVIAVKPDSNFVGTLTFDAERGLIRFVPPAGWQGTRYFTYTIVDKAGLQATGRAYITVWPPSGSKS